MGFAQGSLAAGATRRRLVAPSPTFAVPTPAATQTAQGRQVEAGEVARSARSPLARTLAFSGARRCSVGGADGCGHPTISRPGDPDEREADHIADRVMRSVTEASTNGSSNRT